MGGSIFSRRTRIWANAGALLASVYMLIGGFLWVEHLLEPPTVGHMLVGAGAAGIIFAAIFLIRAIFCPAWRGLLQGLCRGSEERIWRLWVRASGLFLSASLVILGCIWIEFLLPPMGGVIIGFASAECLASAILMVHTMLSPDCESEERAEINTRMAHYRED